MRPLAKAGTACALVCVLGACVGDPAAPPSNNGSTSDPDASATGTSEAGAQTDDAATGPGATTDGAPPGDPNTNDAAADDAGGLPGAKPGDVVVLMGDTVTATNGKLTKWSNKVAPALDMALTREPPPSVVNVTQNNKTFACVAWADGDAPLSATGDAKAYELGDSDYSITAIVEQGPPAPDGRDGGRIAVGIADVDLTSNNYKGVALMSDYQDAQQSTRAKKFAGRLTLGTEVVEGTLSTPGMHVVTVSRRGDGLYLRVDANVFGPTSGASLVPVPPKPLMIGGLRTDDIWATAFAGKICGVIVHRGVESDPELEGRVTSLRKQFGLL